MRRSILAGTLIGAAAVSLTACATAKPPKLAVCDGNPKHRRDANPYGSVLPGAPAAAPAPPSASAGDPLAPPPPPAKTSAIRAPTHFASC